MTLKTPKMNCDNPSRGHFGFQHPKRYQFHKFYPLKGTTSAPVIFWGEYPPGEKYHIYFNDSCQIQLNPLIRTRDRLFRIPRYFELKPISLGLALQSLTIGYFELPIFRTISPLPMMVQNNGVQLYS